MTIIQSFSQPDFRGVSVHRATSTRDLSHVVELRQGGFGRHLEPQEIEKLDWLDKADSDSDSVVLLARIDGAEPVATLRIASGKRKDSGIASYVPINKFISEEERPYVQFARLSAPRHSRAKDAMFALFKSAWRISEYTGHNCIVLATPPWAKKTYQLLQFRDVGDEGEFVHNFGRPVTHRTMVLPIHDVYNYWRNALNPLCELYFDTEHPDLVTRI